MRADEPIDAALASRVREQLRKLDKRLAKARKKRSPDAVHDGRTAIRRVTEALAMMGATAWDARKAARAARELDDYEDVLAEARDCDVLLDTLRAYARKHRRDARGLGELEKRVAKRRERAANEAKRVLRGAGRSVARIAKVVDRAAVVPAPKNPAKAAPALVRHFVRELVWKRYDGVLAYDGRRSSDPETLHAFRSACRKLRYGLELLDDAFDVDRAVVELRAIQDEVGAMHDAVLAVALVEKWLRRGKLRESKELRRFASDLERSSERAKRSILKRFDRVVGDRFRADLGRALEAA